MHDSRRTRLVLGVLLIAALALITIDVRDGATGPVRGLRGAGGTIFGSAESLVGSVTRPVAGFFGNVTSAPASQQKIAALQREVVQLRTQLSVARLSRTQEAQLQQLLSLAGRGGYRIVAANVIAASPGYQSSVTARRGPRRRHQARRDGAERRRPGRDRHLGGRAHLDRAAQHRRRVHGGGAGGRHRPDRGGHRHRPEPAGPALLRLQVFDASAVLQPGQQLVTFGSMHGRPYVPGVPVGVITQVQASATSLTKVALVRPYADYSALGVVGVVIVPPRTTRVTRCCRPARRPARGPPPRPAARLPAWPTARRPARWRRGLRCGGSSVASCPSASPSCCS